MVSFPHCKINLGLHVLCRRSDGYHDLETVFYPLPLKDVLEIIPSTRPSAKTGLSVHSDPAPAQTDLPVHSDTASAQTDPPPQFAFTASGLPIPGNPATNLCARAWHLLKKDFSTIPSVDAYLYKNIPTGAGLGGGSADGAFMLKLLDKAFKLQLGRERLAAYALQLGSDCPFFLYDEPCFATGRGERLEPVNIDLSGYFIVLVYPGLHVSTAEAFSDLHPDTPAVALKEVIARPVSDWRSLLINDFEGPVCERYPELRKIKDRLYDSGAVYASMTGSGSAFYGLFPKAKASPLPDASLFPGYFFRIL